jgi:ElaB/YqjD/DUF883 family membrane-anchored ribosome-binding protein
MDRNGFSDDATPSSGPGAGSSRDFSSTSGFGNTGDLTGSQGYAAGTTADVGQALPNSTNQPSQGFTDRARDIAGSAQEKLADVGSTVRERSGQVKNSLADALHSGAEKLRQRTTSTSASGSASQLASATDVGSVAVTADSRTAQVGNKVASGMDAAADFIRDTDLDSLKTGVERQVKEHPGRTLLIAAGLGYLLGKAFRNK